MLHNGQQVNHECQYMTLGISMLTNIFLHTNMVIIISSTPMDYAIGKNRCKPACPRLFKWRPRTFKNTGSESEFGKPR